MMKSRISKRDPSSPLATYLREIDATPLLTEAEERELASRVQSGDPEARDHLVRANLRLVVNIARGYQGWDPSLPDLIAEGNMGLIRAVEAFDPAYKIRFSTYASYWIKQSIKRGLINTARTVRLPAYMVSLLSQWRRATNRLHDEMGHPPSEEEVAAAMKLPLKKLASIRQALAVHTTAPGSSLEDESGIENLASDRHPEPGAALAACEDQARVHTMLERLEPREASVLRLRFGLDGGEAKTLQQIGNEIGLTRERTRQIERTALKKLAALLGDNEVVHPKQEGRVWRRRGARQLPGRHHRN